MRTSSIRLFNRLCLMAGLLLLVSAQSFAQHAASNYVRVSNDGVNTDRFHDPEYAAWLSIERYNARSGTAASYYIFDHIEANFGATFENWRVYYNHMKDGVLTGPHFYGSSVIRYFVCDYTPLIGPSYGSDVQGLPRGQSSNPMTYATGCPVPQGIVDKNPCLSHCDGNPINVGMMNKVQVERDLEEGGGLLFERRYNSIGFHYGAMLWYPTLGALWQHNFDRSIQLYTSSSGLSTAAALRPDGRILKFTLTSGIWTPDADVVDGLQRLVDGSGNPVGWSYTTAERNVETYGIDGRLNLITLRGGTTLTLSYSTSATSPSIAPVPGLLIGVADNFGRALQLTYDANKRIQSVTDPAGGVTSYAYDSSNNLVSVTRPGSAVRTYVYGELTHTQSVARPNHLTGIVDESGVRFADFKYDNYGRAISTSHANSVDLTTVAYTTNGAGNVTSAAVTDALGTTRTKQFVDRRGVFKLSAVTENGVSTALSYDTNGNLSRSVDKNGNSTCFSYDARNLEVVRVAGFAPGVASCPANLASYTPAIGTRERKIATTWHATYRLPISITEANRTTSFTHDANGNVLTRRITDTSVTPNVSRTWTYTFNSFGQVLTENGPRTDVSDLTTYAYYTCATGFQCGQLNTITNALGHVTIFNSYNAHGRPTQITDANGLATSLSYDARQRLTDRCSGATLPGCIGGELTHLDYWPIGLLKRVTNPDASYVEYTYDAAHRLTQISDGALNKIIYTLDAVGNRTGESSYDPSFNLKRTHTRVFNSLSQLWKDVNAAGTVNVTTTFGYDNNGNQTTVNAPLARNSSSLYDELDRLKQITDPNFGNTLFGYDANDNLTSVTDPRSLLTSYAYTGFGDLKTQTSPDTGLTTNTYDTGGNLKTSTDARSAITTYTYDALNRVKTAAFKIGTSNDPAITYTYDAGTNGKGHLTGASDSNHSMSWSYDAQGRIVGKGQTVVSVTKSIGYGYNASGQLASTLLPSGQMLTYGYNANNQVTSITLAGTPNVTILSNVTYDPFGPVTGWTWGNSTIASRSFDTDGKLTQVTSAGQRTFGYDDAFRITAVNDIPTPANSWSLGYDLLDRLNVATKPSTTIGYSYDANGNRLTQTGTSASTYAVDAASNKLSSTTGALARTYTYDAVGNVLDSGATVHTYNNRGRLKTARLSSTSTNTGYIYNALGQRVRKSGGTPGTVFFVYDEAGHLVGEYNSTGVLIQETVWLGDIPVATIRSISGVITVFYVHTDQLNTPRKVTNTANTVRWKWDPTPFGEGVPVEPAGAFKYNLRFPGQYFDLETNLNYNYFRDFDPATGRYAQSDPIGLAGGLSTFAYVQGSPIDSVDPRGLAIYRSPGGYYGDVPGPGGCESAVFAGGALVAWIPCPEMETANDYSISHSQGATASPDCIPPEEGFSDLAWELLKPDWTMALGPLGKLAKGGKLLASAWTLGAFKKASKWESQMAKRGWTPQQITEAVQRGERFAAENLVNRGNAATRYVHPQTGQSVVIDNVTNEVIHVGGPGFKY